MAKKTLDHVYESHIKDIYTYIYSFCHNHSTTEEIVQETFYQAYLNLEELTESRIKPWLFKVAYHSFIDHTRKEKRHIPQEPHFFEYQLKEPSFEKRLLEQEKIQKVFLEINQLPFQQKQALLLSAIHHLTHSEIAIILNTTESGVKSLIFRARTNLKKKQKGE